jgi:hypothetical protein
MENEHFVVWMRIATLPTFRKLWGIIEEDLDEGKYDLTISNNYDVSDWDGEKHIVLTTVNGLGGKNYVLGIWYLSFGSAFLVLSLVFILRGKFGKKISDSELKW